MKESCDMITLKSCLLIAFLASSGFLAVDAIAQTAPAEPVEPLTREEMLVADGQVYAKTYGVTLQEAMRRILVMNDTSEAVDALATEFNGQIGGQFFTHGADFGLKMRLTGKEKRASRRILGSQATKQERQAAQQAAKLAARDAKVAQRQAARRAKLGLKDSDVVLAETVMDQPVSADVQFLSDAPGDRDVVTQTITTKFSEIQSKIPMVDAVGYDERQGVVVVTIVGANSSVSPEVQTAVAAMFPAPVKYEYVAKHLGTTAATGGTPINTLTASALCTVGFVGYDASNRAGLFSAAHCRYGGTSAAPQTLGITYTDTDGKSHTLSGDPSLSAFTTHHDMLFLILPAGLQPSTLFFADKGTAARALTGRRTIASTTAKVGTTAGSWICFYGRTTGPVTGQSCGEVTSKGDVFAFQSSDVGMTVATGTSYYVRVQAPSATMKCAPGDSGAPWFALSIAFGTMARCAENWSGANTVAYYTSMDIAYAKNYRLNY
jgi:hypothetical protein